MTPTGSAGDAAAGDAASAAARLAGLSGVDRHDVAVVLGSGWLAAADALGPPGWEGATTALPGFAPSAVDGHAGRVRSLSLGGRRVLVFLGRTHLYESHGVGAVVHGVRVAVAAGCEVVVLTNACGGVREGLRPGQPVLIGDHINLTGASPLAGARFVDLTDLYSARLRAVCRELDPSLDEGVYVGFRGPEYETPAEIGMARAIGGDLVGMSTVHEAIAARAEGAEVLGISLVTNLAAGLSAEGLDHDKVLAVGRASAARVGRLLAAVVPRL